MQSIKISIPEGYEVAAFDEKTGEISFKEKPKDIKERIKTYDDVLKYHGIETLTFESELTHLSPDEQAYRIIKLIVSALNEGWVPDWSDRNQYKYYPWFKMGSPAGVGFSYYDYDYWTTNSGVGSRLCFKSSELAKYAGTQFEDIYKTLLTH